MRFTRPNRRPIKLGVNRHLQAMQLSFTTHGLLDDLTHDRTGIVRVYYTNDHHYNAIAADDARW